MMSNAPFRFVSFLPLEAQEQCELLRESRWPVALPANYEHSLVFGFTNAGVKLPAELAVRKLGDGLHSASFFLGNPCERILINRCRKVDPIRGIQPFSEIKIADDINGPSVFAYTNGGDRVSLGLDDRQEYIVGEHLAAVAAAGYVAYLEALHELANSVID